MHQYKKASDLFTFIKNHFLSSDEGRALVKAGLGDDKSNHDILMKQLDTHTAIMQQIQNAPQVALGNPPQPQAPMQQQTPGQQLPMQNPMGQIAPGVPIER